MLELPTEIKDAIACSLEIQDLKNLRLASHSFNSVACHYLFKKLILSGAKDNAHEYLGLPACEKELYKHKSEEFCKLRDHIRSITPLAGYFTTLDNAPVLWDADLLNLRIGTHSGKEEDGFQYSFPYTAEDWAKSET
ncbi:hypothetical protein TWF694_009612 [Orbilia ellipsospora]|uniref:F-box domain-containing protein n=1 Tax=Orbilia ellipsospora TaxID=2528407 RepID=A0AAV9XBD0_9PEZI